VIGHPNKNAPASGPQFEPAAVRRFAEGNPQEGRGFRVSSLAVNQQYRFALRLSQLTNCCNTLAAKVFLSITVASSIDPGVFGVDDRDPGLRLGVPLPGGIANDYFAIKMPGGMAKNRYNEGEANEERQRANQ
jgi:hypothetical protein